MKIIRDLNTPIPLTRPATLTIGNFDGVHLGHRAVLAKAAEIAKKESEHTPVIAITFENHPSDVLRPHTHVPRLCTLKHRLKLLKEAGIDTVILLPFTKELSQMTAEEFLKLIQSRIQFSNLVLGHDATIGKERQGNRETIQKLAAANGFTVTYLDELTSEGTPVSSSRIRQLIQKGDLDHAEKLLGRKYAIFSTVEPGLGHGRKIGFPTANIELGGVCLPPFGVYAMRVKVKDKWLDGVANLGYAPTVRSDHKPILEVHLFDHQEDLYNHDVEAVFCAYLRPEMKFSDIEALKMQIAQDIAAAKEQLRRGGYL